METGPQLRVSSDRLEKLGIEPAIPHLQGGWFIHNTMAAPNVFMALQVPAKVFCNMWSYHCYYTMLSTE